MHAGMPDPPRPGRPLDQADPPPHQADPPDQADPLDQADPPTPGRTPPQTRHTHPPDQADPPGPGRPPMKQTPAYSLRAAGAHPTGMHSCYPKNFSNTKTPTL